MTETSPGVTVLSLFSGIGGLDLGLIRAGMALVGQVESDPFCRAVLSRQFPEVPQHDDVRTTPAWWSNQPRPRVDVLAGGFPCQPFSDAGTHYGMADERWGWPWMLDVVDAVRPRFVLVENVAALLRRVEAMAAILDGLAARGFAVEWQVVSACAVGAPHVRRRLFIVAYPDRGVGTPRLGTGPRRSLPPGDGGAGAWADPGHGPLATGPGTGRVADGVPGRLDPARVTALGNAVVPQIAEYLGWLITDHAADMDEAAV